MKTLFSLGFQSNNPFTVRHPALGQWENLIATNISQAQAAAAAAAAVGLVLALKS